MKTTDNTLAQFYEKNRFTGVESIQTRDYNLPYKSDIRPFRKTMIREDDELFQELFKDPVMFRVFFLAAIRARRKIDISPIGLEQFEFCLSETEYEKFGLKKSQRGQIRRALLKLDRLKVVQKTETEILTKTGSEHASVWRFVAGDMIDINPEIESEKNTETRPNRDKLEYIRSNVNINVNENGSVLTNRTTEIKTLCDVEHIQEGEQVENIPPLPTERPASTTQKEWDWLQEEYKRVTPVKIEPKQSASDPLDVIVMYREKYRKNRNEAHPMLTTAQRTKIENVIRSGDYADLELGDWESMMDKFFSLPIQSDFHIGHFFSEGILQNRFWECVYRDS